MPTDGLKFKTPKGSLVLLQPSGSTVRISVQNLESQHSSFLVDIKEENGDTFLVTSTGLKVQVNPDDAVQARKFLAEVRNRPSINKPLLIGGAGVVGLLFVLGVIGSLAGGGAGKSSQLATASSTAASSVVPSTSSTSISAATDGQETDNWTYSAQNDAMSGKPFREAGVRSTNTVDFNAPYEGAQHGTLILRQHPRYGNDVILTIERGQFLCQSFQECHVLVKFDDKPAMTFSGIGPSDNSSEQIFIKNYKLFAKQLQGAKHVLIEAEVFQDGRPQFDFDVHGFNSTKLERAQP